MVKKFKTIGELYTALFKMELTNHKNVGYMLGLERTPGAELRFVSHVYKGPYDKPEKSMCPRGYNRGKQGFSIWRNNIGKGICRICLKNTFKELS